MSCSKSTDYQINKTNLEKALRDTLHHPKWHKWKLLGKNKMATQLELEKSKKRTDSNVKTTNSQSIFLPTPEEQTNDLMIDQNFCVSCKSFHKPNAKLRCAFNRAITKIESRTGSNKRKTLGLNRENFGEK